MTTSRQGYGRRGALISRSPTAACPPPPHQVRNLEWLGFSIPRVLTTLADDARAAYPYAVSMQATLRAYQRTVAALPPASAPLVAGLVAAVQAQLTAAFEGRVAWNKNSLPKVRGCATYCFRLSTVNSGCLFCCCLAWLLSPSMPLRWRLA